VSLLKLADLGCFGACKAWPGLSRALRAVVGIEARYQQYNLPGNDSNCPPALKMVIPCSGPPALPEALSPAGCLFEDCRRCRFYLSRHRGCLLVLRAAVGTAGERRSTTPQLRYAGFLTSCDAKLTRAVNRAGAAWREGRSDDKKRGRCWLVGGVIWSKAALVRKSFSMQAIRIRNSIQSLYSATRLNVPHHAKSRPNSLRYLGFIILEILHQMSRCIDFRSTNARPAHCFRAARAGGTREHPTAAVIPDLCVCWVQFRVPALRFPSSVMDIQVASLPAS
jgi:hypothetical protein